MTKIAITVKQLGNKNHSIRSYQTAGIFMQVLYQRIYAPTLDDHQRNISDKPRQPVVYAIWNSPMGTKSTFWDMIMWQVLLDQRSKGSINGPTIDACPLGTISGSFANSKLGGDTTGAKKKPRGFPAASSEFIYLLRQGF